MIQFRKPGVGLLRSIVSCIRAARSPPIGGPTAMAATHPFCVTGGSSRDCPMASVHTLQAEVRGRAWWVRQGL